MANDTKKLSLIEIVAMAVGAMIGASIFSIFGLGAQVAGQDLPESFILSGVYAIAVAYSYAILGSKIISNAGPIGFVLKGLGDSLLTGTLSILLWMSYVISIALLISGFSGYFLPLFHIENTQVNVAVVEALLIALFVVLNFFGSKAVGKSELFIVLTKLAILFVFIIGGFSYVQVKNITPSFDSHHLDSLVNASIIFFLSYTGFGLITNASENLVNPKRNVPIAIVSSILIVIVIYVSISLVTLGNLPLQKVVAAKENALAIAAKPFLGQFGFLLISIGALFSTASALNASIFGGANIAYSLAKDGELPEFYERKVWFKSTEGLYITAGLGLIFAILFDLGDIATIMSCVFTIIYIFVIVSHIRLRKTHGGNLFVLLFNLALLTSVFVALVVYQWQTQRSAFYATLITFAVSFIVEYLFRVVRKREITDKGTEG